MVKNISKNTHAAMLKSETLGRVSRAERAHMPNCLSLSNESAIEMGWTVRSQNQRGNKGIVAA